MSCRIHYMRGIQSRRKTQRQRPLVFFFTTRGGGYKMEATTSLSLSLSLSLYLLHTLYNFSTTTINIYKVCALSHIYTYMTFRHIYICVLLNRSEPIGIGSEIGRFSVSSIRRDMFPNTRTVSATSLVWCACSLNTMLM